MSSERASRDRPIRVLVVDDEPLGRLRVQDLLRDEPEVEVVGAAADGAAAVEAIRTLRPDLVFLDVQMPGKTGLEVVREVGVAMPVTIFVTAYDRYALQAFDVAAADYLVKPFDDERFEEAFRRARRRVELEDMDQLRERLLSVLQGGGPTPLADVAAPPARPRYLDRIAVDMHGQVIMVPTAQIAFVTASGPYARLHTADRRYVIREAMQTLEEWLDPERFVRIHRSVIVRLDLVERLHRRAGGHYEVELRGGARLRVSRSRREGLERRLGITP